jgi:hypothetical protein
MPAPPQLLLHELSQLPSAVRLLLTARPMRHLLDTLRSRHPRLVEFAPGQLRRSERTQAAMQGRLVERFGADTATQLLAAGGRGGDPSGGGGSLVYFPG